MAFPGMGIDTGSFLSERDRKAFVSEMEQQAADVVATGSDVEGEGGGRDETDGSPGGILRDPLVQKALAVILGALVGGGIAYVVFGRKGE